MAKKKEGDLKVNQKEFDSLLKKILSANPPPKGKKNPKKRVHEKNN